jgi:hypothetical protein
MPRLITEGGHGVALAYRETAMKAPVDCITKTGSIIQSILDTFRSSNAAYIFIYLNIIRYPALYLHKSNKRGCHHRKHSPASSQNIHWNGYGTLIL